MSSAMIGHEWLFWLALALFSFPLLLVSNPERRERGIIWAIGGLFITLVPSQLQSLPLTIAVLFGPALITWAWAIRWWFRTALSR